EILTQVAPPYSYFAMVLNLQSGRHRHTFELIGAALSFASTVGQRFKHHFRIARPADRSKLVQPVLMTPGHGAYPAGHSTQMHLVRLLLVDAWKLGGTAGDWRAEAATQLERLANRIAENRVVAGLHYEADNEAGKLLAQQ